MRGFDPGGDAFDLDEVATGQFNADGAPRRPITTHLLLIGGIEFSKRFNPRQEAGRFHETSEVSACCLQYSF